jgi:hypothetical protein
MPDQDAILQQQQLLTSHRQTLFHYLDQKARLGATHIPPSVIHGIREARDEIRRIKTILRGWGVNVEDRPDDQEPTNNFTKSEVEKKQATSGCNTLPEMSYETTFQQDLNALIQQTVNNFEGIKGEPDFIASDTGSVCYKSKFSFEYSTSNDVWQRSDGRYSFTCDFYKGTHLEEADVIFTEYSKQIQISLAKEWRFQEQSNPDKLHRKELEGIRRYNTMRLELKLIAYKSSNRCEVIFKIEKDE